MFALCTRSNPAFALAKRLNGYVLCGMVHASPLQSISDNNSPFATPYYRPKERESRKSKEPGPRYNNCHSWLDTTWDGRILVRPTFMTCVMFIPFHSILWFKISTSPRGSSRSNVEMASQLEFPSSKSRGTELAFRRFIQHQHPLRKATLQDIAGCVIFDPPP